MAAAPPPSFVSKPTRGWLHPDHLFARDGINYAVRFIGCIAVTTSMKALTFDTRSAIAKECINRVCEAAGLRESERGRLGDRMVQSVLGERVSLSRAGTNVQLTITSLCLKLSDLDTGRVIHQHDMPNISFASGGDGETDTLDYVAYVAKDGKGGRACYVLECGGGLAQDVITTVGQAFELRFKEFLSLKKSSSGHRPPPLPSLPRFDDPEYYNDLPAGKAPPHGRDLLPSSNSNLIDLSTDLSPLPSRHDYVNNDADPKQQKSRDPFDMSPFALAPPGGGIANIPTPAPALPPQGAALRAKLVQEEWFHGPISRKDAEELLRRDGDFLVRESQGSPGQYVLTGMQGSGRKHLLLVDPQGIVRTRDRSFDSVSHLIDYHRNNKLPIISAESALRLEHPVPKQWK